MQNIKKYITRFWSYVKNNKLKTVFFIVLIVVIFILLRPNEKINFEYISPEVKTFKTTIEGSGNLSTESSVNLVSLATGQISHIKIKPGDTVKKGQILATISSKAQQANLTKARAEYEKVVNGSSEEDIYAQQTELDNALRNLYSSDLIAEQNYSNPSCTDPVISGTYNGKDSGEYIISIQDSQSNDFRVRGIEKISDQRIDNDEAVPLGTKGLMVFFPDGLYECASDDSWRVVIPNVEGKSYLTNYNTYLSAKASFSKVKAPSRHEEILSAQGALQSAEANYEDTIIRAPFDGQIGKVSITVGEFVQIGTEAITIIGYGKIADITLNEVDIANIKIGQKAILTFDALPDLELTGSVTEIDTSGTDDSGVIIFGVKIVVETEDERVKPGMSVTGTIVTAEKENAIVISNTALKEDDTGQYYVLVKDLTVSGDNPNKKVFIKSGLSNDIETEIIEGLTGNEEVLYREINQKESKQSGSLIRPPRAE